MGFASRRWAHRCRDRAAAAGSGMDRIAAIMSDPPPGLGPAVRPSAWDADIVLDAAALLIRGLPPVRADVLLACLLLWHDRLDAAHALVQRHEGQRDADCVHAIMHRREPDLGNSRYWWERVGRHPFANELAAEAERLGLGSLLAPRGSFDPGAMAAACIRGAANTDALLALQARELRLLATA